MPDTDGSARSFRTHTVMMVVFLSIAVVLVRETANAAEDMLPHKEMGQLSFEEKKFLLAVERGDVATTRR